MVNLIARIDSMEIVWRLYGDFRGDRYFSWRFYGRISLEIVSRKYGE